MEKRVVAITGSHKGLGWEIARQLAKIDTIKVIISSRGESEGLEAQKKPYCKFSGDQAG